MKKLIAAMMVAAVLAGCHGHVSNSQDKLINDAQAWAAHACGFVPSFGSLVKLLGAEPTLTVAAEIGGAICEAINSVPNGAASNQIYVSGVLIEGSKT